MSQWYYMKQSKPQGPISGDEIKGLVSQGKLGPLDLVFETGERKWKTAYETALLKPIFQNAEPATKTDIQTIKTDTWVLLRSKKGEKTNAEDKASKKNFQQMGPFPTDQVLRMLQTGEVGYQDHAWREGMKEWYRIANLEVFNPPKTPPMDFAEPVAVQAPPIPAELAEFTEVIQVPEKEDYTQKSESIPPEAEPFDLTRSPLITTTDQPKIESDEPPPTEKSRPRISLFEREIKSNPKILVKKDLEPKTTKEAPYPEPAFDLATPAPQPSKKSKPVSSDIKTEVWEDSLSNISKSAVSLNTGSAIKKEESSPSTSLSGLTTNAVKSKKEKSPKDLGDNSNPKIASESQSSISVVTQDSRTDIKKPDTMRRQTSTNIRIARKKERRASISSLIALMVIVTAAGGAYLQRDRLEKFVPAESKARLAAPEQAKPIPQPVVQPQPAPAPAPAPVAQPSPVQQQPAPPAAPLKPAIDLSKPATYLSLEVVGGKTSKVFVASNGGPKVMTEVEIFGLPGQVLDNPGFYQKFRFSSRAKYELNLKSLALSPGRYEVVAKVSDLTKRKSYLNGSAGKTFESALANHRKRMAFNHHAEKQTLFKIATQIHDVMEDAIEAKDSKTDVDRKASFLRRIFQVQNQALNASNKQTRVFYPKIWQELYNSREELKSLFRKGQIPDDDWELIRAKARELRKLKNDIRSTSLYG